MKAPLLLLTVVLTSSLTQAASDRPNVILIMTDDQGYGDLSCHGNPLLKTPNLDKIHAQSVRLTDFHVAPMCTPTRGQLLTGMDCLRNGASSVSAGRSFVRRGIPFWPETMAKAGYKTALFGKWHLGDSYPNLPQHKGFHESVYHLSWGITSMADTWQNDLFDGHFRNNSVLKQYKGYCTDVFFDLGMKWMKERQTKKEPFFLYIPTNAPHGPHWVPDKYKKPYMGKGPAPFFGMIANIDENIGKLEKFLDESGLKENTLLIYLQDNGGTAGVKFYNAGLRAGKTTYYDGGHRSPCFIRWPAGKLGKPRDLDTVTQVQDLLPTVLELCGIEKPNTAKLDGFSLAGLLRGTQEKLPDRLMVVQYGEQPGGQKLEKGRACVMWNQWRLVHNTELYDIKKDLAQKDDVAAMHPDIVKKMQTHYEKWWKEIEPGIHDFEPVSIGADEENPVTMSSADWNRVYCDNMGDLRRGREANGPWSVLVEKDGEYEFALRRWPKEANAAITAGVPAFKAVDGMLPEGKALPIARARLKIAELDESKAVGEKDKEILFTTKLKGGTRLPMQTWFLDANGKELCGAYFVYVKRR